MPFSLLQACVRVYYGPFAPLCMPVLTLQAQAMARPIKDDGEIATLGQRRRRPQIKNTLQQVCHVGMRMPARRRYCASINYKTP